MKLTKDQLEARDATIDWHIAQVLRHASHPNVWIDYSPTSKWDDAGKLIEEYKIDIRYFDPTYHPDLPHPWMGGLFADKNGISYYFTAFGETPLMAAMNALVKAYPISS